MALRVAETPESTSVTQWKHIDVVRNTADLGTRGIKYAEFVEGDWLQVPLRRKNEDWISHIDQ